MSPSGNRYITVGTGVAIANAVLAKIGTGGKVCIYTHTATDVIIDTNGYVS